MTFRVLVTCDGTPTDRPGMALDRCRGYITQPVAYAGDLADRLNAAGWHVREPDGAHLCPSCARHFRPVPQPAGGP